MPIIVPTGSWSAAFVLATRETWQIQGGPVLVSTEVAPENKFDGVLLKDRDIIQFEAGEQVRYCLASSSAAIIVSMKRQSGSDPVSSLSALTVDPRVVESGRPPGTVVGALLGTTAGSTLTLTDPAGGRFALSGGNIVAGSVPTDYDIAQSHDITVRETLAGAANSPRDSTLTITVEAAPVQPVVPAAPVLSLVSKTDETITVSWPAPANGGSPITGYRLYVGGSLAVSNASSPLALVGLEAQTEYSITVAALNAVGEGPQSAPLVVTTEAAEVDPEPEPEPEPHALGYGYLAARDEGTDGDWFVAPDGDDVANDGKTVAAPLKTIQAALDAAAGGDVIRVRGGVYRGSFSFAGKGGETANARTTVARYGTEEVIISGAELVTDWQPCTAADAPVIGNRWAGVHKKMVPLTTFSGNDPRAANPFAGGKRLLLANTKGPSPQLPQYDEFMGDWQTALEVVTVGVEVIEDGTPRTATQIRGYKLPALTDLYTQEQIERCDIAYYRLGNWTVRNEVKSFDPEDNIIHVTDQSWEYGSSADRDKFVLLNMLPNLRPGHWGWHDHKNGQVTIYIWPHDQADMASVEITRRGLGVNLAGVNNVEIRGLIFEKQASVGPETDGQYAVSAYNTVGLFENIVVDNVEVRNTFRAMRTAYSPVLFSRVNGWRTVNLTVARAMGQFGFVALGHGTTMAADGVLDRFLIRDAERSPFRIFGQKDFRVTRGQVSASGVAAHSNKAACYLDCEGGMWWGVDFSSSHGYFTWQKASGIHVCFCNIPAMLNDDGRAIVDQNYSGEGSNDPRSPATMAGVDEVAYLINNSLPPFRDGLNKNNALTLGRDYDWAAKYALHNNVSHGLVLRGDVNARITGAGGNIITHGPGGMGDALATGVYTDLEMGDISIRADSPTWAAPGQNLSAIIAILQGKHPGFDGFDRDLAGNPFDPANPPIGPYASAGTTLPLSPVWVEVPKIQGASLVGNALTLTPGYLMGAPYPARSRQWIRSQDGGVTWQPILNATGQTYTPSEADAGWLIGADLPYGARTIATVAVSEDYPIATPHLMAMTAGTLPSSAVPLALESASYVSAGQPLLVVASARARDAEDAALTVTVGAPGRAFGTGTALDLRAKMRRTVNQSQIFTIINPPIGEVTVQMQSAATGYRQQLQVYEIGGLTGIGAVGTVVSGTSPTSLSPSIVTTQPDGGVLHIVNRFGAAEGNLISLSGDVDQVLCNATTGGTDVSYDLRICVGWARAQTARSYSATAAWPTAAGAAAALSIELRSVEPGGA